MYGNVNHPRPQRFTTAINSDVVDIFSRVLISAISANESKIALAEWKMQLQRFFHRFEIFMYQYNTLCNS